MKTLTTRLTGGGRILKLLDGTWKPVVPFTDRMLFAVAHGGNVYVAVGAATVATSSDGLRWKASNVTEHRLYDVTYWNSRFVACGEAGTLLVSTDGDTWSTVATHGMEDLNALVACQGRIMAVGSQGRCLFSTDGLTWTKAQSNVKVELWGAASSGTTIVIVGDQGTILRSEDGGCSWVSSSLGSDGGLTDVAYGNDLFVIVGDSGQAWTSVDGLTWTISHTGLTDTVGRIEYIGGIFIAFGLYEGVLCGSRDGRSWSRPGLISEHCINGIAVAGKTAVAVGGEGAIFRLESD